MLKKGLIGLGIIVATSLYSPQLEQNSIHTEAQYLANETQQHFQAQDDPIKYANQLIRDGQPKLGISFLEDKITELTTAHYETSEQLTTTTIELLRNKLDAMYISQEEKLYQMHTSIADMYVNSGQFKLAHNHLTQAYGLNGNLDTLINLAKLNKTIQKTQEAKVYEPLIPHS